MMTDSWISLDFTVVSQQLNTTLQQEISHLNNAGL
jgi:hypothetical protein